LGKVRIFARGRLAAHASRTMPPINPTTVAKRVAHHGQTKTGQPSDRRRPFSCSRPHSSLSQPSQDHRPAMSLTPSSHRTKSVGGVFHSPRGSRHKSKASEQSERDGPRRLRAAPSLHRSRRREKRQSNRLCRPSHPAGRE
jgi:hypothetical protein